MFPPYFNGLIREQSVHAFNFHTRNTYFKASMIGKEKGSELLEEG